MKHFQELLNPVNMPCLQEAVPKTSSLMESISVPEITMAGGKAASADELEMLNALDKFGVMWLTPFFNVAWKSGAVDWETDIVAPIFQKGDKRLCFNYRGIILHSLPGKVYARYF